MAVRRHWDDHGTSDFLWGNVLWLPWGATDPTPKVDSTRGPQALWGIPRQGWQFPQACQSSPYNAGLRLGSGEKLARPRAWPVVGEAGRSG